MPQTKLIYGVGRVPRASEFALGEIIVNVDDSKVYSKNKLNVVFEITGTGGGGSQLPGGGDTIINEGDDVTINVTSQQAFATASVSGSGFFTSVDVASNLIISGGGGISVTTGSGNQLFITTGSSFTVATASFVQTAQTASYVSSFDIFGGLFSLGSGDVQGQIIFSDNVVDVNDIITAQATNLSPSSDVEFRNITSSAGISASSDVFVKRLRLSSGANTGVSGIIFDEQAGNSGFIYDDGAGLQLGYNDVDLITVSSSNDVKVRVAGNTLISNGYLNVESNITASGDISSSGDIKAYKYLLRGNELAQITTVDGIANTITIGDSTNQNQLNFVGSNIRTAVDFTSSANISASGELQAQMLRFTQGANNYIRHTDSLGINIKSTNSKINIQGNITASGAISASSLLFASASQPAAHAGSIVAVVYDTSSGRFYYTGSYGAGGSGADNDWFIDTNRLTSSLDVYVRGDITGSNLMISGAGGINFDPQGDSFNNESVALRHMYGLDSDGDSKRIVFQRSAGGNYNTLFSQDSVEYMKFNHAGNLRRVLFNNLNPATKQVDVEVMDSSYSTSFFVSASGKTSIGSNTTTAAILTVKGNISASGYLELANNDNTTGVAGALMYSSSNEFYLGFS